MKILYVASEVVPFSKTGGLADVAGALPGHLRHAGCDARVAVPLYKSTLEQNPALEAVGSPVTLRIGTEVYDASFAEGRLKNSVPVYFVDCDELYNRDGLYGTAAGDYPDNADRFIFFCRAVLELCRQIDFVPDIIHCNDWQTGLIPAYIKAGFGMGMFDRSATVFTIHNLAYQGLFGYEAFQRTGLPEWFYSPEGLEFWGQMSMLKAGIVFSRGITTVSPRYASEIQTPEFGCGLEGVLRNRQADLYGILNGVDYDDWNPETDRFIAAQYTSSTLKHKLACKKELLAELGLPAARSKAPLLGSISRLVDQKGFDLIAQILPELFELGACYVLLGSGDPAYEKQFADLAGRHKKHMAFSCGYDNRLAHKIEAGCDMFLMPSRYEPCGLNQVYSLKYGTVPIVRATGGLDDTIVDHTSAAGGQGTGFKFSQYAADALLDAAKRALLVYADPERWRQLMLTGMACDYSWEKSATQYLQLYASLG